MPGPSGKNLPVFLGGSDLAIPVKSKAQGVAAEWINAFTGAQGQKGLLAKGNLPNNKTDLATLKNDPKTVGPGHRGRVQLVRPDGTGLGPGREGPDPEDHAAGASAPARSRSRRPPRTADAAIDKVINTK